jgi:hypothetical protein
MRSAGLVIALAPLVWVPSARAQEPDCEAARCAVQNAIAAECRCDEATNHGRYVSCVAHAVKRLSRDGTVPINCRGKVMRCAARSTCGKPGRVTCHVPLDTCDTTTFTCVGNQTLTCATDIDCGSRCATRQSAEICEAQGGVVGTSGTCCAACPTAP